MHSLFRDNIKWHRLPNYSLIVGQSGFAFRANNFFFRIVDETVQRLTSAGILNLMIERCFPAKKSEIDVKEPFVLKMEDLNFGFIIWFGCCGLCGASFVTEKLFWYFCWIIKFMKAKKKLKKIKFMKIHPQLNKIDSFEQKVKKTENLFRVQKSKLDAKKQSIKVPNYVVNESNFFGELIL